MTDNQQTTCNGCFTKDGHSKRLIRSLCDAFGHGYSDAENNATELGTRYRKGGSLRCAYEYGRKVYSAER